MDVDEMIIKASTEGGDATATTATGGVNGTPVGPGASTRAWGGEGSHLANAHAHSFLVGGQQHQQQQQQQGYSTSSHHHHRRRSDRDRDLDSPAGAGGAGGAGGSAGAGGVNPYPGSGSGQSFNAGGGSGGSASASAMRVLGPAPSGSGEREGRSYTTVFAPVVTGAPTKKSKFPNSLGGESVFWFRSFGFCFFVPFFWFFGFFFSSVLFVSRSISYLHFFLPYLGSVNTHPEGCACRRIADVARDPRPDCRGPGRGIRLGSGSGSGSAFRVVGRVLVRSGPGSCSSPCFFVLLLFVRFFLLLVFWVVMMDVVRDWFGLGGG